MARRASEDTASIFGLYIAIEMNTAFVKPVVIRQRPAPSRQKFQLLINLIKALTNLS